MNARETIAADKGLIEQWNRYVKTNSYVEGVTFADACAVLSRLLKGDLLESTSRMPACGDNYGEVTAQSSLMVQ